MAKTYKILVNDGKGTDIKPVSVVQGASANGEPVRMAAKRGWRFELQDDLKGKNLGPDQVRLKRMGKNLGLMFDGSVNPDVIIEDFYAENEDKEKDNGSPMIVGQAEDGGMYEYVPQDPAASSMASQLKDGNTPVIVALGGGPLAADFALAGLPLIAAAGGGIGGLLAGGAALVAAAAAGGGGGGGNTAAVVATTVAPTVTIDTDSNNDGYVNKKEVDALTDKTQFTAKTALPTTAVAGDTITVTDGTTTKTHVLTAADITNKFVTDTFTLPTEGSTITVTAKMTSAATGVSSANATDTAKLDTSAFIDPVTPEPFNPVDPLKTGLRVTINSDENNDGILSSSDLATTDVVKATIALTKDAAVGDVLTVKITNNGTTTTRTITLTDVDIAAKQVVLKGLAAPANGNTIKVEATIQDVALNASPSTASDSAVVNTAIPGVTILNDANNDGFINKVESDKATKVSVKVEVPDGAGPGNTINVSNGTTTISHPLTREEVDAKHFILTNAFAKPAEGATITVTAVLGTNTTGGSDSAKLDASAFIDPVNPDPINPVDPTKSGLRVTINSDVNNDGFLSNSDLSTADLVKASIALTTDAAVGDLLTVAITGNTTRTITLTAAHIAAKQVVLTGLTAPVNGDTITVTATLQDVAGNATPAVAFDSAKVNTAIPGVMITTDINNDGVINNAELNNASEVTVRIEVPKTALVGDLVTVTDGITTISHPLTDDEVRDRVFTETFAKPAVDGASITVTASFGGATGTDTAKLDATAPTNSNVGLGVSINTDGNNDTFVTAAELGTSATFNSRATFDKMKVEVGDQIDFTFKNGSGTPETVRRVLTATDIENGFVDKTFAKPVENTMQTVTVNFVDKAGNPATDTNTTTNPKLTDNATLDVTAPTNEDVDLGVRIITDAGPNGSDGIVSNAELNAQRDVNNTGDTANFISRATFTSNKAVVGHKIILNAKNGTTDLAAQTVTLTQADVDRGFVEVKFAKPSEGQTQTVTAMYADAAGNADTTGAPTDFASLDTVVTTLAVEVITDGANGGANDDFVNNAEIGNDTKYNVEARFESNKVEIGDKVQFTVGGIVTEVAIDQTMKTAGKVALMFDAPTTNGASFNVKVVIKDAVGNSTEAQDTVVRNKLIAVNDTAEVTAPTNSTPNTTPAANVLSNDADPQFLPNPASPAALQVFVSGIKLSSASAFSAISNNIAGQFGSLKIDANGSYTYTVSNTTAVEALGANDSPVETFVYQVTDNVGNVSTATLAITVKGVNDRASHVLKDQLTLSINDSNTNPLIGSSNALLITDKDDGESALSSVAATGSTPFTGSFGTLTMTQSSHTATQTGYSYSYSKNASSGISDTTRHDLFTFKTQDGTDSVTFDIQLLNTSGVAATKNLYQTGSTAGLKIATATTSTEDTLKLVGSQMTFDFTGTAATTDIKSIETVDITGTGNNTIKLDLNSLMQADVNNTTSNVHQLFINGNNGDAVNYLGAAVTSTQGTGAFSGYNIFRIDDTHELLVQQAISVTFQG